MRRFLTPPFALIAGLALVLTGCAGETPTAPTGNGGGPGGGTCNVAISLAASSLAPLAGSATLIRATATKSGTPIPDGSTILFATDYGFFLETGLPTVSKIVVSGVADVTLASDFSGRANVKATLECGTALIAIQFGNVPASGPFISSIVPNTGTCAGGDNITINGGRFGTTATRITFGGLPATIVSVADTVIVVKTPARTLANPQIPEAVDVVVTVSLGSVTATKGFTYYCVDSTKRIFISSVVPNSGSPDGGLSVAINGGNFGTNVATTRVTFGGVAATVTAVTDAKITVLTPRHALANPTVPETVDVAVTIDLGLVSQQSAVLTNAFTYRASGTGGPGTCTNPNSRPGLFISRITPNVGSPDGGLVPPANTPYSIEGGGFVPVTVPPNPNPIATTRVDVGGFPAQILSVADNLITISIPRRILANPSVPETVDVVVTVDVGGPNQACTIAVNGFTYAAVPVIYSTSPKTGPNDASTRVTIFGAGFQFPLQVFMTATACGAARIEATVVSIKSDQVVFLTPIASNGNGCLANQLASITVLNPVTGLGGVLLAVCADCFKYYSCPSVFGISPQSIPYNQTALISINGQNFEEPVEAKLTTSCALNVSTNLLVTSVASSIITVQVPPIDPLKCSPTCANVTASITLTFQSMSCPPLTSPAMPLTFTYRVDPVTIATVGPQQLNQDGTPSPITVTGTGFLDPMTAVLTKGLAELSYTRTNNTTVANPASLTFPSPAIENPDLNEQACVIGTSVIGKKYVPTSFGVQITNARTGCSALLPNALVYIPLDQTCRSSPFVTNPATLPAATLCSLYGPVQIFASGGTAPYTYSAAGLPPGVTINALTGQISGTPSLAISGPGTATAASSVTITITDAIGQSGNRTYSFVLNDPGAPFTVTGTSPQTIANAGFGPAITVIPTAFLPIAWTSSVATSTAPGTITVAATGTGTTNIGVAGGVLTGTYIVTVTATDNACGTFKHTNSQTITVNVP